MCREIRAGHHLVSEAQQNFEIGIGLSRMTSPPSWASSCKHRRVEIIVSSRPALTDLARSMHANKAIRCCIVPKFFGVLRTPKGVVPNQADAEVPVSCPVFLANVMKVAHLSCNNPPGRNVDSIMLGGSGQKSNSS